MIGIRLLGPAVPDASERILTTDALAFVADLPLWPGSNRVTVIGRANAEVRTVKTMYVYREPPRTAQAPTK